MSSLDEVRDRVRADVARVGWHVTGVFPTEDLPPDRRTYFCYTVGLWQQWQHPELLVFGLRPEVAQAVFHTVVERIKAGERFEDGCEVDDLVQKAGKTLSAYSAGIRIAFRRAPNDDPDWPTMTASAYYGHRNYDVVQLVLADAENRLPWEEGCDEKMIATQTAVWLHEYRSR